MPTFSLSSDLSDLASYDLDSIRENYNYVSSFKKVQSVSDSMSFLYLKNSLN